jgi:CoA:oxalate CoA-transferase
MSFERPYEGLRVVDLSQGVAGPYCGMLLARQGADVIKIEPKDGDWARRLGQEYGDQTAFSISANLGKRSIVVDLKHDDSRAILDKLIAEADVFIEGFRPGVTDRLGYSYERLAALNPKLIYVSVAGFGHAGPMRERPAMDPLLQAFSGFMSENLGGDGIPHRTTLILFDMSTALYAQQAVGAALYARRDDGKGRKIDLSLMEAAAAVQTVRLMDSVIEGPYKLTAAPAGTFKTQDGWLQMIVVQNGEFQKLCKALGWSDFATDPRFATNMQRRGEAELLNKRAREQFASNTTAHWQDVLTREGVQNEKVQTYREFAEHPQTAAVEAITWLPQEGSDTLWPTPNVPGTPKLVADESYAIAPTLGQHTAEILAEFGYDAAAIEALTADGVVG